MKNKTDTSALFPPTQGMTRRDFLRIAGLAAVAGPTLAGCAVNPVSGRSQLMLVSRDEEISMDRQESPHQFSNDLGAVQDKELNKYVSDTGKKLASLSHRPDMPYSFRAVNATYVNAYAFPGGSIAATRGILLELGNEAELAGLLGHEIGHVNARHTASRMTQSILASVAVTGATIGAGIAGYDEYTPVIGGIGGLGSSLLLAKYSRDDERQADDLGMQYMHRAGYNPQGMVGLMNVLRSQSHKEPSTIEVMFATHPMSDERYETAKRNAETIYKADAKKPLYKERFMDHTAGLRRIKPAIKAMQNGDKLMQSKDYKGAEKQYELALQKAPNDYAALIKMSKCMLAQDRNKDAERYADKAAAVYPKEAQGHHFSGIAKIANKDWNGAYAQFSTYEKLLPGNPSTVFLQALSLEGMGRRRASAKDFARYLNMVNQGDAAKYAYTRLYQWGYVR
ncbi:MAG: M48 family metalloprotease [Desulfovibrio sp.]|uniref:M48 family metalloprotease n=1 Tax=Desulfovibrio sp. 7SRBS1 TaxID=3378064 RepID=UPI003B40FE03